MKGLREPFPKSQIGMLPKTEKRPAMPYVGHAAVTDRLNGNAPGWTMDVRDQFERGNTSWVLLRVTIDGVPRDEYGDGRDPKAAIGNALRRCAMRWGVALDLWSKEELDPDSASPDASPSVGGGGGTNSDPIPPTTSAPEVKLFSGEGAAEGAAGSEAGGAEANGLDDAPSAKDCTHEHTSPLRPDGTEMPINKVRCLNPKCGKTVPA
jgi:hypothetical protein